MPSSFPSKTVFAPVVMISTATIPPVELSVRVRIPASSASRSNLSALPVRPTFPSAVRVMFPPLVLLMVAFSLPLSLVRSPAVTVIVTLSPLIPLIVLRLSFPAPERSKNTFRELASVIFKSPPTSAAMLMALILKSPPALSVTLPPAIKVKFPTP